MTSKATSFTKALVRKKSFSIETELSATNSFQISAIKSSVTSFNEEAIPLSTPPHTGFKLATSMKIQTKIRPFKGLRDGREDPLEYIEDIEWETERNHNTQLSDVRFLETYRSPVTYCVHSTL